MLLWWQRFGCNALRSSSGGIYKKGPLDFCKISFMYFLPRYIISWQTNGIIPETNRPFQLLMNGTFDFASAYISCHYWPNIFLETIVLRQNTSLHYIWKVTIQVKSSCLFRIETRFILVENPFYHFYSIHWLLSDRSMCFRMLATNRFWKVDIECTIETWSFH